MKPAPGQRGSSEASAGAAPVGPEHILQVGLGFWASKVLLSGVSLGVFTELAKKPGSLDEIQQRLGLHPRAARDFLDALVALRFLERTDGVYRNSAAAECFLDRNRPSYLGGILEMAEHRLFRFWADLTEALRTGNPQNETKGGGAPAFHVLYADPARLEQFLKAMTGISRVSNMMIAAKFPWADRRTFVDVGAAQGDLAVQVALAHAHLSGVGFDLPQVAPVFDAYMAEQGVAGRVRFAAGDFFADPFPQAEVVMMGHILHDWNLEEKKQLIRKAYQAVPLGGALIVYDSMIDDDRRENAFGLLMSLNMLIETRGGFDYTGADCVGWMKEAGFREARIEHLVGPDSMAVAIK